MILKIQLVVFIYSFQFSISKNISNLKYLHFQSEESVFKTIQDEGILLNNIITSSQTLYVDISVIITPDACRLWQSKFNKEASYFLNITRNAKNLFALHKIELRVSHFEEWCDYNRVQLRSKLDAYSYGGYFSSHQHLSDTVVVIDDISGTKNLGIATIGTICTSRSVAILDVGLIILSQFGEATRYDQTTIGEVLVHEIGHNLGFPDVNYFLFKFEFRRY
ncbi:hypothetical protein HZS_3210 [Henneguya salminicola]|nr:hypothetical protein HZS_3210 [Henneguya salminicola]